ncbi:MAG: VanZ family protein [Flexilinea sp.]
MDLIRRKKIFQWILVLIWMGFIFYQSSQQSSDSLGKSGRIIQWAAEKIYEPYYSMDELGKIEFVQDFQNPVRKAAHFCEYTILGILVSFAIGILPGRGRTGFALIIFLCLIYAASDEIHQLFVSGRTGSILDWLIDSAGSFIGSLSGLKIMGRKIGY